MSSSAYRRGELAANDRRIRELREENAKYTKQLQPIPIFPEAAAHGVEQAFRSSEFLVQLYAPKNGAQRITISRTMIDRWTGAWLEGITWDQLQFVKNALGFADKWAVEIYPPRDQVVNVANMRHIFVMDEAPPFGWRKV